MTRRKTSPSRRRAGTPKAQTPTGQKSASATRNQTPKRSGAANRSATPRSTLDQSPRKKRRFRPGVKALRQIKLFQRSVNTLIPKASFCRVVREILQTQFRHMDLRIQSAALEALQEACEMYVIQLFQDAYLCSFHARRVTLQKKDVHLVRRLRGVDEVVNR